MTAVSSLIPPSRMRASGLVIGTAPPSRNRGPLANIHEQVGERLHGPSLHLQADQAEGRHLADPAQRHGRLGRRAVHVGEHGRADLVRPGRRRVNRGRDAVPQFRVHHVQQRDVALFLAGELGVEGAPGRAGVPDDVGDLGVPEALLLDGQGQTFDQPLPERQSRLGPVRGGTLSGRNDTLSGRNGNLAGRNGNLAGRGGVMLAGRGGVLLSGRGGILPVRARLLSFAVLKRTMRRGTHEYHSKAGSPGRS